MRFYHKMGIGKKKKDPLDDALEKQSAIIRMNLVEAFLQASKSGDSTTYKQALDQMLGIFLTDYLLEQGIFRKK